MDEIPEESDKDRNIKNIETDDDMKYIPNNNDGTKKLLKYMFHNGDEKVLSDDLPITRTKNNVKPNVRCRVKD